MRSKAIRPLILAVSMVLLLATVTQALTLLPEGDGAELDGAFLQGMTSIYHVMSDTEVDTLMGLMGVNDPGVDYNHVVDGLGTGLAPPTEEQWAELRGSLTVVDDIVLATPTATEVDLSDDPWFPEIRSQGSQGSCAAWAITYYAYGYLEAKDNGWTDAWSGNDAHLMSPAWTYNKVNGGTSGSSMTWNGYILEDWGCASLGTMPYDDDDDTSWGSEMAFREAPIHRAADYHYMYYQGDSTVDDVKALLSNGVPVTFAIDSDQYSYGFKDGYVISSAEYYRYAPDHAQTIVGYDDSISDDGEMGAFKVANSWGESFGEGGYYWLTYEAFKEIGSYLYLGYVEDISDHSPEALGVWEFAKSPTNDASIELGIGDPSSPESSFAPRYKSGSGETFPSFMCIDLTDVADEGLSNGVYLDVGGSSLSGTVSVFKVELYSSYPGEPTSVSTSDSGSTPGEFAVSFASQSVPGVPVNVRASVQGDDVTLSWSPPTGTVAVYNVYRGSNAYSLSRVAQVTGTSYLDGGLDEGTYYYAISAANSAGEGTRSSAVQATVAATDGTPGAVGELTATGGDGQVTLDWDAPEGDVQKYKIYRGTTPDYFPYRVTLYSTSTEYTYRYLANGVTYYFMVTAINDVGEGPESAVVSATPGAGASVPTAPVGLKAPSSGSTVQLSWSPPSDDGGSSVTSFKVYRGTSSSSLSVIGTTSTTSLVDDVLAAGTYYYAVSAVNSVGEGARSSTVSATIAAADYGTPGAVGELTATGGDGQVTLDWDAPEGDVQKYKIYRGTTPDYFPYRVTLYSTSTEYTYRYLANGVTYYFMVTAINDVGEGPESAVVSATPGAGASVPTAPVGLKAAVDSKVSLTWNAPVSDGGAPVTLYKVYRGTSSTSLGLIATTTGVQYSDASVSDGTYYYAVSALNSVGESVRSSTISVTKGSSDSAPLPPSNVRAVAGDGKVTLTWDHDDPSVTNFKIYRSTYISYFPYRLTVPSSYDTYSWKYLSNGVTYYFVITAINEHGESAYSEVVSATPNASLSSEVYHPAVDVLFALRP